MIALSKKIIQIHYFGNKCLVKTEDGLIPLNEYCSFIIKSIYDLPREIDGITSLFIEKFKVCASFEDVRTLIHHYIYSFEHSKQLFCEYDGFCEDFLSTPLISGDSDRYVPYLFNIELTNTCNLNCLHCYKEANCSNPIYIDLHKLEELFLFLNSKNLSITLTGGEPTTHKSFEKIVDLCSKFGNVDVVTNGLLLKSISSTTLKKLNLISVSLYGIDDLTYEVNTGIKNGFYSLSKATEYLRSIGKSFILSIVLDKEKIENLEEYIDVAIRLGANSFQIGLPFRSGKLIEESNDNEKWILTKEEKRIAYRKIRELKKNNNKIQILDWERDVYEKKHSFDDPNNPSNFYITHCMKCGAGTTQWSISEDFNFRPCNILSGELAGKISFESFKDYVDGKNIIDWIKYMNKYREIYSKKYGLELSDCCERLTDFIDEK